ncbi:hypothetical protein EGW08_015635 [Elysia chlorotica]|uniref:RCC1-like domain-containing protein n=1 Tax=Elysia chlorotica TaxID=188477 RepID=A0A3S0ZFS4_ELYCH|nr:hypothetical protein EGW08_015635 [Elysia chlorotica]
MTTIDERAEWAVWAWGANNCGQLGCGHRQDLLAPTVLNKSGMVLTSDLEGGLGRCTPTQLTGGGAFSVLLTDSGQVLTCGKNDRSQLGQGPQKGEKSKPRSENMIFSPCTLLDTTPVARVAAGWDFVLALTGSGSILSWGSNSFGQLGRACSEGVKMDSTPQPVICAHSGVSKFVEIAAGLRHALAISECGHTFSWGSGRRGQLGVVNQHGKPLSNSPSPISLFLTECERPSQVVAGMNFSGVLTETGSVYLWGCNKYGQCGVMPTSEVMLFRPTCLKFTKERAKSDIEDTHSKFVSLGAGWTHLILRTDNGQLYSLGRSDLGQLGRSSDTIPPHIPGHVSIKGMVTSHVCSSEHNLALTDKGQVYSWGWNEHGICGTGNENNVFQPQPVSSLVDKTIVGVGCGAGHCFCWTTRHV